MPIYRVESDGTITKLRLGIVTAEGVDFGEGPNTIATHVRAHKVDMIGSLAVLPAIHARLHAVTIEATAAVLPSVHARIHYVNILANTVITHVRLHESNAQAVSL